MWLPVRYIKFQTVTILMGQVYRDKKAHLHLKAPCMQRSILTFQCNLTPKMLIDFKR